jgi:hypothetical protein
MRQDELPISAAVSANVGEVTTVILAGGWDPIRYGDVSRAERVSEMDWA